MRKIVVLIVSLTLVVTPYIGVTQSTELPMRIAYFREFFDEDGVTGRTLNLLEGSEVIDISADYNFTAIEIFDVSWSATCDQLIFTGKSDTDAGTILTDLIMYDLTTVTYTTLATELQGTSRVDWSPDGANIALTTSSSGIFTIAIMNITDGSIRELVSSESNLRLRGWSPDSKIFFFVEANGFDDFFYSVDITADTFTPLLVSDTGRVPAVAVAPDNTQFAFLNGESLYLQTFGTDEATQLTTVSSPTSLAFSPDGQQIAYGQGDHVWLIASDGSSAPINLTEWQYSDFFYTANPIVEGWTVDGEYIIYSARLNFSNVFQRDLFALTPDASDLLDVTTTDPDETFLTNWYPCMLPE